MYFFFVLYVCRKINWPSHLRVVAQKNVVSNHSSKVSGVEPIEECNIAIIIAKDEVDINAAIAGTTECGSEPLSRKAREKKDIAET